MRRTGKLFALSVLLGGASFLLLLHAIVVPLSSPRPRAEADAVQTLNRAVAQVESAATELAAGRTENVHSQRQVLQSLRQTLRSANNSVNVRRRAVREANPAFMAPGARTQVDTALSRVSEQLGGAQARIDSAAQALETSEDGAQLDSLVAELSELSQAIAALTPASTDAGALSIETLVALGGLVSSISTMILGWRRDRRENERFRTELDRLKLELRGLTPEPATGPGTG